VAKLEEEWSALNDDADVWRNRLGNALANLRIFEDALKVVEDGLTEGEGAHGRWSETLSRSGRALVDYEHLQRLSAQVATMEDNMADLREQASRMAALSPATQIQLDRAEVRLRALREDLDEQQKRKLSSSAADRGEDEDENSPYNAVLPSGWERGLTREKIPYYLNHADENTQWDHPAYSELMCSLLDMNDVKFSAYRLSLKLRRIQRRLCLDLLDLEAALVGFEEHGLTRERHDLAIQVPEMALVLTSIYQAIEQEEGTEQVCVPLCVDLCLNWLLNVYDGGRVGQVRVASFKVGVLVLCRGPLTEKYLHLFKLVAPHGGRCLTPRQLALLLHDAIQVPKVLGEVASFGGSNVEPSVRSCFTMGLKEGVQPLAEVDARHFLRWLRQEPQCLVWLPVLHRLAAAEVARHTVKCRACKAQPIVGFRYHCLKCFNFDLCGNCFFVGRTAKGHKPEHPMQEYCTSTGASVNLKNLGQAFRNSFRSKKYFRKKQAKLGYLPVTSVLEGPDLSSPPSTSPNLSATSRDVSGATFNGSLVPKVVRPEEEDLDLSDSRRGAYRLPGDSSAAVAASEDDEHSLIARICRRLQDENAPVAKPSLQPPNGHSDTDSGSGSWPRGDGAVPTTRQPPQKEELEAMIADLEEENRKLCIEYEQLKVDRLKRRAEAQSSTAMAKEARQLKQHSARMEARMRILEEHNGQLEEQLGRLRELLAAAPADEGHQPEDGSRNFGTLQSRSVVASQLPSESPAAAAGGVGSFGRRRRARAPPTARELFHGQNGGNESSVQQDDADSLDLSDHETQRVDD